MVEAAVRTQARYIGMLGSERKKMLMWKKLESEGGDRGRLDQGFAPIGVNIGADTPEEIAVSVMAEIVAFRHDRPGGAMKVDEAQLARIVAKLAKAAKTRAK